MSSTDPHKSQEIPPRLYHYTSLESLALILSNKTIRLMPIAGMDDLQEAKTSDIPNLGRFVFANSWTDDETESIPMWNMYASLEAGVRIALPAMPFKQYRLTAEDYSRETGIPLDHISMGSEYFESFLPPSDFANKLSSPSFLSGENVLIKVEYTSDMNLLEPKTLSMDEKERVSISIGVMGKYKNEYWRFQHEWRYLLLIVPFNSYDMSGNPIDRFSAMMTKMVMGILPPPCPYYDLHISDDAMKKLEVVASPKMSAGNKVLLETLLKHHGQENALIHSALTGLL